VKIGALRAVFFLRGLRGFVVQILARGEAGAWEEDGFEPDNFLGGKNLRLASGKEQ